MSTRKSAKSAHAGACSSRWQDLSQQARNSGQRAGQITGQVWRAPGSGPRWAMVVCWLLVAACSCLLMVDIILHARVSAFFAVVSILCGLNFLRRNGWWK